MRVVAQGLRLRTCLSFSKHAPQDSIAPFSGSRPSQPSAALQGTQLDWRAVLPLHCLLPTGGWDRRHPPLPDWPPCPGSPLVQEVTTQPWMGRSSSQRMRPMWNLLCRRRLQSRCPGCFLETPRTCVRLPQGPGTFPGVGLLSQGEAGGGRPLSWALSLWPRPGVGAARPSAPEDRPDPHSSCSWALCGSRASWKGCQQHKPALGIGGS
ncbi:uncharacterized protein LOC108286822 [Cebus imitator]|uniref:uncharacterized protein LOC108286822 n=1 Tax=Cebus imitator TaxID=2715852 RepID=UPI000809EAEB|nr:uncharacterized protein LOC108286822 [Cebus imitator]